MHRPTIDVYEARGGEWAARRKPVRARDAVAFRRRVPRGALRLDAGAGAGRYTGDLGRPVIALDAARTMLQLLRDQVPHALVVQGDLEAMPFRRRSIAGAWANMSYLHVPRVRLPMALADLHHCLVPGAPVDIQVLGLDYEGDALPDDDLGGRFFAGWPADAFADVLVGAGFDVAALHTPSDVVRAEATRMRSLPDTVGAGMRVLVCGLNPAIYAADRGVGFARPGNRFWPGAIEAGLVSRPRDPHHALVAHGVGMTDLCKRATVASSELTRQEYLEGAGRVSRLVAWLQPRATLFVGLEGWRAAVDRHAVAGPQPALFGGRPAYVMPSTSGLNARSSREELVEHLRAAVALADRAGVG